MTMANAEGNTETNENVNKTEEQEPKVLHEESTEANENVNKTEEQEPKVLNEESTEANPVEQVADENITDVNNDSKENQIQFNPILAVRIIGFKRLPSMIDELKLYYTFFTEEMNINPPLVEIPAPDDDSVLFQLKSDDDKEKLFAKLKRKVYIWKTYKLEMKWFSKTLAGEEIGRLTLDNALKILYPYRDLTYVKQLKEKSEISKAVIGLVFPKDSLRTLNIQEEEIDQIRPILPSASVEGYDYHVSFSIEVDPETKDVIAGIRVVSEDKKETGIVPIDLCLSVPHQMALVVKDFVKCLPEFDWHPYNPKSKKGDILGITMQMTTTGHYIMTVIIPNIETYSLKQLTANGVDGEETSIEETHSCKTKKSKESAVGKIEKYLEIRGKDFGIESVYLTMINARFSIFTCLDEVITDASHILGELCISDNHNGLSTQVTWSKDLVVGNSIKSILNIIHDMGNINNSSVIHLLSPCKIVALYLAKKYSLVKMFCGNKGKDTLNGLKTWSKTVGINNIEFLDASKNYRDSSPKENAVAIVWNTHMTSSLRQLLECSITNFIFISYWTRDPSVDYISLNRLQLELILQNLKLCHIYPIDVAPYTERHGLIVFFRGRRSPPSNKRTYIAESQQVRNYGSGKKRWRRSNSDRRNYRESSVWGDY